MNQTNNILSVKDVSKSYGGVTVLHDVFLDIKPGEVHAVIGANGAGKSTLIKTISGAIVPDKGIINFDGQDYTFMTPERSDSLGIKVVYQEFNLVPSLSVAENIFLGERIEGKKLVDFKYLERRAKEILDTFEVDIDVSMPVKFLSVAYKQIVEIAKGMTKNIKLLVLDEPTAPLTNKEVDVLYKIIRKLKNDGIAIIYISHRLEEVFEVCDNVTVLRDGHKIITLEAKKTTRRELINYMIDADLGDEFPERIGKRQEDILLDVKDLAGKGFNNINFSVRRGEILGIAGLVGAKRTEIVRAIYGADKKASGSLTFEGKDVVIKNPSDAISNGIVMVPEERKSEGLILNHSIKMNLSLMVLKRLTKGIVLDFARESKIVDQYKDALSIKMRSTNQSAYTLSGGNQQKIVISKCLASDPKLIILDEPTRGVDVGTKKEVYSIVNKYADEGLGVILISSELDEVIGLSDRIVVLAEGKITAEFEREDFDKQEILYYASLSDSRGVVENP